MTSELPEPVHVLSEKSYTLRRDIFIFWQLPAKPAKLVVGLNQRVTPVTSAKLHRWIRLMDPKTRDFYLRPVKIKKYAALRYTATPAGPAVPPESTSPLPPGDYAWFNSDGTECRPFFDIQGLESFEETKKFMEQDRSTDWSNQLKLYTFPPSFEQMVLQRDTNCFITGMETSGMALDLGVSWIYPPTWVSEITYPENPRPSDIAPFISISNAGLMRKDLVPLFHDNAFGVDVDDDYRIVVFRDLGSVKLPSSLQCPRERVGPDNKFLRLHFYKCLMVHLFGGDIGEDYSFNDMWRAAEELGLGGDSDLLPLDDERWQSVLGKELLEQHLNSQLWWAQASDKD